MAGDLEDDVAGQLSGRWSWDSRQTLKADVVLTGIRQIELDVFSDPNGGLFATAGALKLAGGNGSLADPQFQEPGFKVSML